MINKQMNNELEININKFIYYLHMKHNHLVVIFQMIIKNYVDNY